MSSALSSQFDLSYPQQAPINSYLAPGASVQQAEARDGGGHGHHHAEHGHEEEHHHVEHAAAAAPVSHYNCDHQTISQKATNCISEFFSDLQIQLPGMDCVIWIQNLSNAQDKHGCMKCALGTRPKQWTLDID